METELNPSKPNRFTNNPMEEEFYDHIVKEIGDNPLDSISFIIHGVGSNGVEPKQQATEEEVHAFLATIQWLGSPIGSSFLNKMGYSLKEKVE